MSLGSNIEWTEATWNPVTGCTKVSAGCKNCYAERLALRLQAMRMARYRNGFRVTLHEDAVGLPKRWREPRLVFVNSMSDLFHELVPEPYIFTVFDRMAEAGLHTYQILTKRPERMAEVVTAYYARRDHQPLSNVWLGVSIENDRWAHRAYHLRATPAAVRFISAEPLLGPLPSLDFRDLDWVIVGGESGGNARPMHADWVRDLRDRAAAAGIAFFFKQWGGRTPRAGGRLLDGQTWEQYPDRRQADRQRRVA